MARRQHTNNAASQRTSARLKAKVDTQTEAPKVSTRPPTIPQSKPRKTQKLSNTLVPQTDNERSALSKVRGRRGHLKLMTEMPLDILLEIFSYLQPMDLLHLARATKALRAILMQRSGAASVWKSAFTNATPAPPSCPSDLNLPQYANLLYGRHCQFCSSIYGSLVDWCNRIRTCSSCISSKYQSGTLDGDNVVRSAELITNGWMVRIAGRHSTVFLKQDYDHNLQTLRSLSDTAASAFIVDRTRLKAARRQHLNAYVRWESQLKREHQDDLHKVRTDRREAIVQKLRELGYGIEVDRLYWRQIRDLPGVNASKPLTERVWENLRTDLIYILEAMREQRLHEDRSAVVSKHLAILRELVDKYTKKQPKPAVVPRAVDLALMEPFRSAVFNTEATKESRLTELSKLENQIQPLVVSWQDSANEFLAGLLPSTKRSGKRKLDTSQLKLAAIFFRCHWCTEPISYPRVLVHNCLMKTRSRSNGDEDSEDETEDEKLLALVPSWVGMPWNHDKEQVTFDEEAWKCARGVIVACGEDPDTVTASQMDDKDQRVECLQCRTQTASGKRLVMKWRIAILHEIEKHWEETSRKGWSLLGDDDVQKAKVQEAKNMSRCREGPERCSTCDFLSSTSPMTSRHDHCEGATYIPLDAAMKRPPYAVKI